MSSWDWTVSSAKWAAVVVLGGASVAGLAWSMSRPGPGVVLRAPVESRRAAPMAAGTSEPASSLEPRPDVSPSQTDVGGGAAMASPPVHVPEAVPERDLRVHRINLNTATQAELELLPGIGPAMAKRILEYRSAKGRFTSVLELDKVKGIGERTMAKLRPLVTVE
ncbi:MAG: helix-hairpin-helix domain-containing protein [Phycisphaeraceae bacterium]|nr:helix-hairpin-helix domain-containing protein [Phycisphaeraceae bacterium]